MSTVAAHAHTRSHEFWKRFLRILGFGVPSMPNPSSGALRSTLPGPRERSGILSAHLALMSACVFSMGRHASEKIPVPVGSGRIFRGSAGAWPGEADGHRCPISMVWMWQIIGYRWASASPSQTPAEPLKIRPEPTGTGFCRLVMKSA